MEGLERDEVSVEEGTGVEHQDDVVSDFSLEGLVYVGSHGYDCSCLFSVVLLDYGTVPYGEPVLLTLGELHNILRLFQTSFRYERIVGIYLVGKCTGIRHEDVCYRTSSTTGRKKEIRHCVNTGGVLRTVHSILTMPFKVILSRVFWDLGKLLVSLECFYFCLQRFDHLAEFLDCTPECRNSHFHSN